MLRAIWKFGAVLGATVRPGHQKSSLNTRRRGPFETRLEVSVGDFPREAYHSNISLLTVFFALYHGPAPDLGRTAWVVERSPKPSHA